MKRHRETAKNTEKVLRQVENSRNSDFLLIYEVSIVCVCQYRHLYRESRLTMNRWRGRLFAIQTDRQRSCRCLFCPTPSEIRCQMDRGINSR